MMDKLPTILTIAILLAAAFFIYENYYKLQAEKPNNAMDTSSIEVVENLTQQSQPQSISFASSWQIPKTNITFRHNASIENGTHLEVFSLRNSGNTTSISLLAIVPKKIAQSAADVTTSHAAEVLREDPVFLFNSLELPAGGIIDRALIVTSAQNIAIIAVLLPADFSRDDSESLLQITSQHREFLESLQLQGSVANSADEVSAALSSFAWQRDFDSMDNFLSRLEAAVEPEERLLHSQAVQQPAPITVSEIFPFGSTSLLIPVCPFANQACGGPLVRLRSSAADHAELELAQAKDGTVKASIVVDFTSAAEALHNAEDGQEIAQIEVEIAYPMTVGLEPQVITVPVEYSRDAGIEFDAARQTQLASFETSDESELQLPIDRSTLSRISPFGRRVFADGTVQFHSGVDFEAPIGTQVVSPADCQISNLRRDCRIKTQCRCGNGVHLICHLSDSKSYEVKMCHLSRISVSRDQLVAKGQEVGKVGRSGMADGPHLHYEIIDRYTGRNIDPAALHARFGSRLIVVASR